MVTGGAVFSELPKCSVDTSDSMEMPDPPNLTVNENSERSSSVMIESSRIFYHVIKRFYIITHSLDCSHKKGELVNNSMTKDYVCCMGLCFGVLR